MSSITFILNDRIQKTFDVVWIEHTANTFTIQLAYNQPDNATSQNAIAYTRRKVVHTLEDVKEYVEAVAHMIDADMKRSETIDIQADGFPCIMIRGSAFLEFVKSSTMKTIFKHAFDFKRI